MPIPKRPKTISQEIDEMNSTVKLIGYACAIWFVVLPLLGYALLGLYILVAG